jgi:hypothetical protein
MSTVGYLSVAHVLLFGAASLVAYGGLRRLVVLGRVLPFTACVVLVSFVVVLPSLLAQAIVALADKLFSSGAVAAEPAWDVGIAMSLFASTWVCYAIGALAASLGSWSFFRRANAT